MYTDIISNNPDVDALGACIGPGRQRISKVCEELAGEKMDVVFYSEDPAEFIKQALKPSDVISVEIPDPEVKSCTAIVPDNQLSLAIGNKGQNAKLAAKLTGFKIDIKPQTDPVTGEPAEELAEDYPDALLAKADEAVEETVDTAEEAAEAVEETVETVVEEAVDAVEETVEAAEETEAVEE